jgi:hypothetical protein
MMKGDIETILVIPLIFALILAGGCISGAPGNRTPEPAGTPFMGFSPADPASVYITYPDFDGGVYAGNVTVMVLVRNFSIVNGTGGQNKPGEGHIVYFKDVTPPTEPELPVATQPGTFQISALTRCTWYNVSQGTHTFAVELVNNDNSPLVPPVIDAVDVTAVLKHGDS